MCPFPLCKCIYVIVCVCVCYVYPVWRLGTVMALQSWTTCRKQSCCVCRHWICTELPTPTSALPAPHAGIDSPPQVSRTPLGSCHTHGHPHKKREGSSHRFIYLTVSTIFYSSVHFLSFFTGVSSSFTPVSLLWSSTSL